MTPTKRSELIQKLHAAQQLVSAVGSTLRALPEAAHDPVKAVVDELEHIRDSMGGCVDQIADRKFARAGGAKL